MAGEVRIGTSGWVYPHWRETFYPKGLPQSRWLEHYAERFNTLELNDPFYCGVGRSPHAKQPAKAKPSRTGNRSERRSNAGDEPYPTTSSTR